MKIKEGGAVSCLRTEKGKRIEEVSVYFETGPSIQLWINQESLSYLDIKEAIWLRDELNKAIRDAAGL